MSDNFNYTKKISKSESTNYYLQIPPKIKLPLTFNLKTDKGELKTRTDVRNRIYVKYLYKNLGLKSGQKIEVSRKNDKYYFTAF